MAESLTRLGVIGCGAAAEICHLPSVRLTGETKIVALADKNLARAKSLGRRFGVERCTEDYHEFLKDVDGVIVALPNYLHAPVAGELLQLRIPVLVEKPLAPTLEEARRLVELARVAKVPLQVGHRFRFSKAARLTKRVIDEGWLGPLQSFSLEFGVEYWWPSASGFFTRKDQAQGGVLMDTGSHVLDLLLWWLGDVVDVEYRDDNLGGVEADCMLSLTLKSRAGVVQGEVILSRLRNLKCTARFSGEQFCLECDLSGRFEVRIWPRVWHGQDRTFVSRFDPFPADSFRRQFVEQLRAFGRAIRERSRPEVSGEDVLGTVALIERCYQERKPLELPWLKPVEQVVGAR